MTIGTTLLREAKEKLEAALAAIKEELKNPDTAEEASSAANTIGGEIDEHLSNLGDALGNAIGETLSER